MVDFPIFRRPGKSTQTSHRIGEGQQKTEADRKNVWNTDKKQVSSKHRVLVINECESPKAGQKRKERAEEGTPGTPKPPHGGTPHKINRKRNGTAQGFKS